MTLLDYRIYVRDAQEEQLDPGTCAIYRPNSHRPDGCSRRIVTPGSPSNSATLTGLRPDRTYYVWLAVSYRRTGSGEIFAYPGSTRYTPHRRTITTLPAPSTITPTAPTAHTHDYAPAGHSHATAQHTHSYAQALHTHNATQHTHSYAAADHTHAAGTGEPTPGTGTAAASAATTCPRFVELADPWTFKNGYARPMGSSVWVAVAAIEYMTEKTVAAGSVHERATDLEGVEIRLMVSHPNESGSSGSNAWTFANPRSFIVEGAALADVVAKVRCSTGPVTTTDATPAPE